MPRYRITDPETGRKIVISGDSAPTQEDARTIFSQINAKAQSETQQQPEDVRSFTQKASDVARNVGLGYVPNLLGTLQFGAQTALNPGQESPEELEQISKRNAFMTPDQLKKTGGSAQEIVKETARDTAGVASWMVPVGNAMKAKALLGGTSGALMGASQEDAGLDTIATGALTGTVLAPLIGVGASATSNVLKKVGEKLDDSGRELILKGLRPSPSQVTKFKAKTGEDLAEFMNRNQLTGDFVAKGQGKIDEVQSAFDSLAMDNTTKITRQGLRKAFYKRIEDLDDSLLPEVKRKAKDVEQIFDELINRYGGDMTVRDATIERRAIDKLLKDNQFGMPLEQASYIKTVRDALKEAIESSTGGKTAGGKTLKELGKELSKLYRYQEIAEKQAGLGKGANILGLLPALFSGAGGVVGGIPGMAVGYGLSKATQNPRVMSTASRATSATGRGLERAGEKSEHLLRLEAMQRLLRQGGEIGATQ